MQLLENIDPNPENYVCAGIIHTRNLQIGTLLRLEPNSQAQVMLIHGGNKQETRIQSRLCILGTLLRLEPNSQAQVMLILGDQYKVVFAY